MNTSPDGICIICDEPFEDDQYVEEFEMESSVPTFHHDKCHKILISNMSALYLAIKNMNQEFAYVTFDQPLYHKAKNGELENANEVMCMPNSPAAKRLVIYLQIVKSILRSIKRDHLANCWPSETFNKMISLSHTAGRIKTFFTTTQLH